MKVQQIVDFSKKDCRENFEDDICVMAIRGIQLNPLLNRKKTEHLSKHGESSKPEKVRTEPVLRDRLLSPDESQTFRMSPGGGWEDQQWSRDRKTV